MRRLPTPTRAVVPGILLVALVVCALAGCGGGSASDKSTFFAQGSDTVVLLTWTRHGGDITGTLDQRFQQADDPTQLVVQDSAFTGTVNGSTVFLQLAAGGTRTGTLHDGRVDLTYPTQQGGLAQLDLGPGRRSDFDHALASLRGDIATTRRGDAEDRTRAKIDAAAQRLSDDIDNLGLATASPSDQAGSATQRLKSARQDLALTLRDEQRVLGEVGKAERTKICSDANAVADDATKVGTDLSPTAAGPAAGNPAPGTLPPGSIAPPTDDPTALLGALVRDQGQLAAARALLPSYKPVLAPAPKQVLTALATARKLVAREGRQSAAAEKDPTKLLSAARGYQQAALKACYSA